MIYRDPSSLFNDYWEYVQSDMRIFANTVFLKYEDIGLDRYTILPSVPPRLMENIEHRRGESLIDNFIRKRRKSIKIWEDHWRKRSRAIKQHPMHELANVFLSYDDD